MYTDTIGTATSSLNIELVYEGLNSKSLIEYSQDSNKNNNFTLSPLDFFIALAIISIVVSKLPIKKAK